MLQSVAATTDRGLLRLLLVWIREMPAGPSAKSLLQLMQEIIQSESCSAGWNFLYIGGTTLFTPTC